MNISENLLDTRSGNGLFVAMDHGMGGVREGFENPAETLESVLKANPDGVLVGRNFAQKFDDKFAKSSNLKRVVTVDFKATSTLPGQSGDLEIQDLLFSLGDLADLNIDGIKTFLIFGRENPDVLKNNMKYLAKLALETRKYKVPLVVEPVMWGKKIDKKDKTDPELIENACRIAFELGADIIKAPYPGDRRTFEKIVKNTPVPVLILGGPQMDTRKDVFKTVHDSIKAGARGIFFGRNIWQNDNPEGMITSLRAIVHEKASVEEALEILDV